MFYLISIVVIVLIVSAAATLIIAGGSGDGNYREATKRNTINLTLIYAVIIVLALMALGLYLIL
jgi:ABC-type methionine transport system permease subunit